MRLFLPTAACALRTAASSAPVGSACIPLTVYGGDCELSTALLANLTESSQLSVPVIASYNTDKRFFGAPTPWPTVQPTLVLQYGVCTVYY